jgi:hypothetical protein
MFTNQQNGATLAHNDFISVQCLYGEALVSIPTTLDDFYPLYLPEGAVRADRNHLRYIK